MKYIDIIKPHYFGSGTSRYLAAANPAFALAEQGAVLCLAAGLGTLHFRFGLPLKYSFNIVFKVVFPFVVLKYSSLRFASFLFL